MSHRYPASPSAHSYRYTRAAGRCDVCKKASVETAIRGGHRPILDADAFRANRRYNSEVGREPLSPACRRGEARTGQTETADDPGDGS